jgi:branched-chain amino acid aminotransferase
MKRAFVYGDLLFESIKLQYGKPLYAKEHYNRLMQGASVLSFETELSFETFTNVIEQAAVAHPNGRARFVLYRDSEGFYYPHQNKASFTVEVSETTLSKQLIELGLYTQNYKPCNDLSALKSGNALLYVLASIWAKEQIFDDALILNEHGFVCEATSSNIFVIKNQQLFTPPLSEGCINGIMRAHLLQSYKRFPIIEKPIQVADLKEVDGILLTNAIQGIVSVGKFENTKFSKAAYENLGIDNLIF